MARRYYAVLTRTDMPIIPYHVHAFDSAARRDAWCADPAPRGFDVQPATAHAALRDLRADMRLDDAWGATVDQYLERHPERWHDGAHDATTADAAAGLHVWWRWCEVNRWEHETWAVYTPMDDPADAELAVRLGGGGFGSCSQTPASWTGCSPASPTACRTGSARIRVGRRRRPRPSWTMD